MFLMCWKSKYPYQLLFFFFLSNLTLFAFFLNYQADQKWQQDCLYQAGFCWSRICFNLTYHSKRKGAFPIKVNWIQNSAMNNTAKVSFLSSIFMTFMTLKICKSCAIFHHSPLPLLNKTLFCCKILSILFNSIQRKILPIPKNHLNFSKFKVPKGMFLKLLTWL